MHLHAHDMLRNLNIMYSKSAKVSLLMFPWLAYGHISLFLELAKRLKQETFTYI